ncbi:MAG TPA: non-canonical purine NTP pyrophosphatase [Rickettsiales bacterium]|nr:non-canonical purine NTP pyrophosphatase [Rickettsiales bacterium]
MEINFITSNKGKIIALKDYFKKYFINDLDVKSVKLDIFEPQASSVKEVSKSKALQAYSILKKPLLVEDGGFYIEALNNFPGVYVRYILDTIGAEGILKLMQGQTNRKARFCSCTTYVDEKGELFQFENDFDETDIGLIATEKSKVICEKAWSDLWYIYKPYGYQKTLAELTSKEYEEYENADSGAKSSVENFVNWFKGNIE